MPKDLVSSGFADRLNQLCDEAKLPERGRAERLSRRFAVTREAARKWLKGESFPTMAKRAEICAWANVTDSWLMSGKGDKQPTKTDLTEYQRAVIDHMHSMTLAQQALAARLVHSILEEGDSDERPMSRPPHPTGHSLPEKKAH